jgi:2'-5' RNA ligase
MSNFGYIQIDFSDGFKNSLAEWVRKSIDPKYFVYGKTNGELIGGIVTKDAHITLNYGIPTDTENSDKIQQEIKLITPPKIIISGIKSFNISQYHAKILYLSIEDKNATLENIHKIFEKFIPIKLRNLSQFVPHISIAYVSDDFDEYSLLYNGPREVQAVNVTFGLIS